MLEAKVQNRGWILACVLGGLVVASQGWAQPADEPEDPGVVKVLEKDLDDARNPDRPKTLVGFMESRISWTREIDPLWAEGPKQGVEAFAWFFKPEHWGEVVRAVRNMWVQHYGLTWLAFAFAALSIALTPRIRARIRVCGEEALADPDGSMRPTSEALAWTHVLVPWLPVLLMYVSWRLGSDRETTSFTHAMAAGLLMVGAVWLTIRSARVLFWRKGVCEVHCDFGEAAVTSLRRHIAWLSVIAVPCVFMLFSLQAHGNEIWLASLGRSAFLVMLAGITVFTYIIAKPGGALEEILRLQGLSGFRKVVWRSFQLVMMVVPIGLAIAAAVGVYWTSVELAIRQHLTFTTALLFLVSLRVAQRRARIRSAQAGDGEPPRVRWWTLATIYGVSLGTLWLVWVKALPPL